LPPLCFEDIRLLIAKMALDLFANETIQHDGQRQQALIVLRGASNELLMKNIPTNPVLSQKAFSLSTSRAHCAGLAIINQSQLNEKTDNAARIPK
jgi:hypothetical protein